MTQELLNQIIQQRLYFNLFFIIVSCGICASSVLVLSLRLCRLKYKPVFLWMCAGYMILTSLIKPFIPDGFFILACLLWVILSLKIVGASLVNSIWIAFVAQISCGVGFVIIHDPLVTAYPGLLSYFNSIYGLPFGVLLESIFPLILIPFCRKITVYRDKPHINRMELAFHTIFVALFLMLYNSSMMLMVLRNLGAEAGFFWRRMAVQFVIAGIAIYDIVLIHQENKTGGD